MRCQAPEFCRRLRVLYLFLGLICGYSLVEHYFGNSEVNSSASEDLQLLKTSQKLKTFQKLKQNDTNIVDYIRKFHLTQPPVSPIGATNYRLSERYKWKKGNPERDVSKYLIDLGIFNYAEEGFFIEVGANNGFLLSNTVDFEIEYGWKGLFIEADPSLHQSLKRSNRNVYIADVCVSPKPYPLEVEMRRHKKSVARSLIPGYIDGVTDEEYPIKFKVPCFPLFSILSAINIFKVDFVSLDIEGAELDVLKTIPFKSVFIKAFQIEACHERYEPVKEFMESKGYKEVKKIKTASSCDQIYVLKKLLK